MNEKSKIDLDQGAKLFIYVGMWAEAKTHVPKSVIEAKLSRMFGTIKDTNHIRYKDLMAYLDSHGLSIRNK